MILKPKQNFHNTLSHRIARGASLCFKSPHFHKIFISKHTHTQRPYREGVGRPKYHFVTCDAQGWNQKPLAFKSRILPLHHLPGSKSGYSLNSSLNFFFFFSYVTKVIITGVWCLHGSTSPSGLFFFFLKNILLFILIFLNDQYKEKDTQIKALFSSSLQWSQRLKQEPQSLRHESLLHKHYTVSSTPFFTDRSGRQSYRERGEREETPATLFPLW